MFQHAAARRQLARQSDSDRRGCVVSTRSRPKAAGNHLYDSRHLFYCFNTQPPEGSWSASEIAQTTFGSFNTQPPEGSWTLPNSPSCKHSAFQHAAARRQLGLRGEDLALLIEFQHAAARRQLVRSCRLLRSWWLSFNTQPPEGSWFGNGFEKRI